MTRLINSFGLLLGVALALPVFAQDPNQTGGDTPEPGVARVSLLSGDVSVRRGDSGELVAAELNAPLVEKDHLITNAGSRAEIQFDYANMMRIAPDSEVRLGELLDGNYLIQVAVGTATFRVLRDTSSLAEISTPTVSVRPLDQGAYRVTVRPDGSTQVTIRSGEAEIFTPTGSELLRAGETMEARGDAANPEFMISSAIPRDEWDRWNENRDNDLNRSRSYQYVSRDIYGADDLDNYGRWVYDQPYGNVWVPNVAPGWAPYRVGRWVNINYYGWTWLSGDPWGWAPYHYGNWYYTPAWGWAWYPGAIGPRYYWRPALVSFFGWGSRGGFSIGIGVGFNYGYVGWVPLAPFEVYRPWFGRGVRNNITIVNNVNIVNNYRNARFVNGRNGVTGINVNNFGRRRTDLNNFARASDRDLQRGGESRGRLPIDASPESRRFNDRQVAQGAPRSNRPDADFVTSPARSRGGDGAPAGGQVAATRGRAETGEARRAETPQTARPTRGEIGAPRAATSTNSPGTVNGGWRRMDDPARTANAAPRVDSSSRSRGSAGVAGTSPGNNAGTTNDGGRRTTSPAPAANTAPRADTSGRSRGSGAVNGTPAPNNAGTVNAGTVNGGWRRFEPSSTSGSTRALRPGAPQSNSNSGGVIRSEPRQAQPRSNGRSRGSEPVQIAPPIVQPRDTGRSNNNFGSGGGTIQRAPRAPSVPQPRISTPQPQIQSPRPGNSFPSMPTAPSVGNRSNRGSSGSVMSRPGGGGGAAPSPSRSVPSAPSMPSMGSRSGGGSRGSSGGGGVIMSRPSGGGGGGGAVRSNGGGGGAPRGASGGGNSGGSSGGRRR